MAKHKHAEVIHAWANGSAVECRKDDESQWVQFTERGDIQWMTWHPEWQYRIKPERVYPETRMTDSETLKVAHSAVDIAPMGVDSGVIVRKAIANAAIKHALDAGQVMLPGGELMDKDIIKAIEMEERKRQTFLSPLAHEIVIFAVKSLLVGEPEIEKLKADRSARDMAIAEAVLEKCKVVIDLFGEYDIQNLNLNHIIATVK